MKNFGCMLALLLSFAAFAAGPPPVQFPQACAPTYCVAIVATYPDLPQTIATRYDVSAETASMTVHMGGKFVVAFSSKFVDARLSHPPTENLWNRHGNIASAWTCLRCGSAKGKDAVLGIALRGIPSSYGVSLSGLDVCVWSLDRSAAGYGDGRTMRLGERSCIRAPAP
jgi:hypothetical protein